jgi:hypothetical protein
MKKMPPESAAFRNLQLLALLCAFALLIGNTAAGFASGLTGSLAFTTAAVLSAFTQIAGFNSLNMFHNSNLHKNVRIDVTIFLQGSQYSGAQSGGYFVLEGQRADPVAVRQGTG